VIVRTGSWRLELMREQTWRWALASSARRMHDAGAASVLHDGSAYAEGARWRRRASVVLHAVHLLAPTPHVLSLRKRRVAARRATALGARASKGHLAGAQCCATCRKRACQGLAAQRECACWWQVHGGKQWTHSREQRAYDARQCNRSEAAAQVDRMACVNSEQAWSCAAIATAGAKCWRRRRGVCSPRPAMAQMWKRGRARTDLRWSVSVARAV
jgi:hypothetical protein